VWPAMSKASSDLSRVCGTEPCANQNQNSALLYRLIFTDEPKVAAHNIGQKIEDGEVLDSLRKRQTFLLFLQFFGAFVLTVIFVAIPSALVI